MTPNTASWRRPLRLCAVAGIASLIAADPGRTPLTPSLDSARTNANHIFNAVHSAGRQWGSALNHNGFGFIPSVMPAGTLLYHGTSEDHPPLGLEWLSFEIEHAEYFATMVQIRRANKKMPPKTPPRDGEYTPFQPGPNSQTPFNPRFAPGAPVADEEGQVRGYLHTYQTTRDLNLLLIDGMSAAKTPSMGTLDSQDLVLRENKTGPWRDHLDEYHRAGAICELIGKRGYDGFIRSEIGFEVVYCDFTDGVELVDMSRVLHLEDRLATDDMREFQWARAVSQRYDGIGGDRLRMDFSSMASGFYLPINISSPEPGWPDRVRLGTASLDELKDLKDYALSVIAAPRKFTVSWQAVVDMITSRFADRLALMASPDAKAATFIKDVEGVTLTYFDAPKRPGDVTAAGLRGRAGGARNRTYEAVQRCTGHHLMGAQRSEERWTPEDWLIYTALETVTSDICATLFRVHGDLEASAPDRATHTYRERTRAAAAADDEGAESALVDAVARGRAEVTQLVGRLGWTGWLRARACAVDEVLFVAMFPFGTEEDHWEPGCRGVGEMRRRYGYWRMPR